MKSGDSKLQLETDPAKSSEKRTQSSVPEIPYQFADPCPESMRDVNIADLSAVDINWKMLTLARPKTKVDEEIFSKYVWLKSKNILEGYKVHSPNITQRWGL